MVNKSFSWTKILIRIDQFFNSLRIIKLCIHLFVYPAACHSPYKGEVNIFFLPLFPFLGNFVASYNTFSSSEGKSIEEWWWQGRGRHKRTRNGFNQEIIQPRFLLPLSPWSRVARGSIPNPTLLDFSRHCMQPKGNWKLPKLRAVAFDRPFLFFSFAILLVLLFKSLVSI